MPKQIIKRAQTSKIVRLFIQDATSTTGAGLTGLTNSSAGLVAYYIREGDATPTAITLAAGTIGTWSSGGFIQVDSVNLPGVYELGLPNAALSSGNSVLVMLKGATNMVPCVAEWELDAYDPQDATRLGLSALPNVAAGAAGGLATATNSSGQVTASSVVGAVGSVTGAVGSVTAAVTTDVSTTVTTNLNATVSSRATPAQILATPANLLATDASGRTTLTPAEHTAISGTDVPAGLTAQGYTAARAGFLDTLNGLVSNIWNAGTRTLTAFGFSVTASSVGDKTGYSLAATGLDAISTADVTNDADARSTLPKMIRATFNRFFNLVTETNNQMTVANDAGTTVQTMPVSDDGTTARKNKSA